MGGGLGGGEEERGRQGSARRQVHRMLLMCCLSACICTQGIVSGVGRELSSGLSSIKNVIQTDAAINPGGNTSPPQPPLVEQTVVCIAVFGGAGGFYK